MIKWCSCDQLVFLSFIGVTLHYVFSDYYHHFCPYQVIIVSDSLLRRVRQVWREWRDFFKESDLSLSMHPMMKR